MNQPHPVQEYLDGALPAGERALFEEHLAECADCRAQVESWKKFEKAGREQARAQSQPPSDEEVRRLMRKTGDRPSGRRWIFAGVALAAAAVAVILILARSPQAPIAVPGYALAPDGRTVPLTSDSVEAGANEHVVVALGSDRLGVAPRSRVKLVRHDSRDVRVQLESGSVAANVSPRQKSQSFVIEARGVEVSVIGTRFRVSRQGGDVRVEVVHGHVRVSDGAKAWDVLDRQVLAIEGGQGAIAPLGVPDFSELEPGPEPAPVEAADAGAAATLPEPTRPAGIPASDLERWRKDAAQGHCAQVMPEVARALREHPTAAAGWQVFADCERLGGEDRKAAEAYRRVIAHGSGEEVDRAQMILARLLHEKLAGDAEAEKVLKSYLTRRHAPALEGAARVLLARVLIAEGRKADAHRELQRVTKQLPSTPAAIEAMELLKQQ